MTALTGRTTTMTPVTGVTPVTTVTALMGMKITVTPVMGVTPVTTVTVLTGMEITMTPVSGVTPVTTVTTLTDMKTTVTAVMVTGVTPVTHFLYHILHLLLYLYVIDATNISREIDVTGCHDLVLNTDIKEVTNMVKDLTECHDHVVDLVTDIGNTDVIPFRVLTILVRHQNLHMKGNITTNVVNTKLISESTGSVTTRKLSSTSNSQISSSGHFPTSLSRLMPYRLLIRGLGRANIGRRLSPNGILVVSEKICSK